MFDREMWKVVPAKTQEMYAGVLSNLVSVTLHTGETYTVPIVVPSALFHYLYTFCAASVDRMTTDDPELFLCWDVNAFWFGVSFSEQSGWPAIDLWSYKKLPVWAERV